MRQKKIQLSSFSEFKQESESKSSMRSGRRYPDPAPDLNENLHKLFNISEACAARLCLDIFSVCLNPETTMALTEEVVGLCTKRFS